MRFSGEVATQELIACVRQTVAVTPAKTVRGRIVRVARMLRLSARRVERLVYEEGVRLEYGEGRQIEFYLEAARQRGDIANYNAEREEFLRQAPRLVALLAPPPLPPERSRRKG